MEIVLVAVFASIIGPATMALITGQQRRREKKDEWDRQDLVADRVEAATLAQKEANQQTQAKLDTIQEQAETIHHFVDGEKTAAMQRELGGLRRELAVLREMVDLRLHNGLEPNPDTQHEITTAEAKIETLSIEVDARLRMQSELAAQKPVE